MKACECTNIAGKSAERVERATKTSERYVCVSGEYTTRARRDRGVEVYDFDVRLRAWVGLAELNRGTWGATLSGAGI